MRLPAGVKNFLNSLHWQGADAMDAHDFIHIQQKIMDSYEYPYQNISKIGGPCV